MTLVSHQAQFIFLKTHKTASTSVEAALEPLCAPDGVETGAHVHDELITPEGIIGARGRFSKTATWKNHMSARKVRRLVGRGAFRRYEKITTMRNPYARMVSMFHSRMSPSDRAEIADLPFDDVRRRFGRWLGEARPSNNLNKLTIRHRYVIDRVVYFERLAEDFGALAAHFGLPTAELPRFKSDRNLRPERWIDYYDEDTRALVERGSAFELAYFGYRFAAGSAGGPNPPSRRRLFGGLARSDPARALAAFRIHRGISAT